MKKINMFSLLTTYYDFICLYVSNVFSFILDFADHSRMIKQFKK